MSVSEITERLQTLHPKLIDLSLDRLRRLLARLGHPERQLPPIVHVAGTNGKGSTCAFIRAMAEAAGLRVHVYTSPHLVRFNERIRVAGELVSDECLVATLERIEAINAGEPITVFEVITAAAFDLFASTPADLCVLEVGLGGRGDATNVIETPAVCAITSISLDHRELLGPTISAIAAEKAGIIKPFRPVVVGTQPEEARDVLLRHANDARAAVRLRGRDWNVAGDAAGLCYTDGSGSLSIPAPSLPGAFQLDNAGIALTTLRTAAIRHDPAGLARAEWSARMQRLHGRLAGVLPRDWELWLDGGHNPGAAGVLAEHLRGWRDRPVHLIVGMKQSKNAAEFLRPLLATADTVWAVQEADQHAALSLQDIISASDGLARPGPDVLGALQALPREPIVARVLICGSLYLAGEVLKQDGGAALVSRSERSSS